MTMAPVRSSLSFGDRDPSATGPGDQSLERSAHRRWSAVETRFPRGSKRIPLLRQPVAIDRVRAGFSGMYALFSAAIRTIRGCSLARTDSRMGRHALSTAFAGSAGLAGFATPSIPNPSNVGDDGLVSSRAREASSPVQSPRTVN